MPNGLLQLLVLMATDIFVCCATIAGTVAAYWEMGADLRPCCYFRLWPLPLIYVAIAAGYGLYRGTWPETKPPWNPVIFLKAQFKAVLLTFLTLFCYLMFTRGNIRYSRVILAVSWFLLIWLLPAGRSIAGRMLHLPAAQLDFNKKLPLHNGLLLPIPRIFKAELLAEDPTLYRFFEQILSESPKLAQEWSRQFKLDNDPRITPLGRFLRKTSLDELPQLWNVLCGDMAIVGPRPIVEEEISKHGSAYEEIISVKPGLTGLWQVSGRNELSYDERIRINLYYIRNWSIWLDYYILLKTPHEIFSAHGQ